MFTINILREKEKKQVLQVKNLKYNIEIYNEKYVKYVLYVLK